MWRKAVKFNGPNAVVLTSQVAIMTRDKLQFVNMATV
jgi:hypothetical protein